MSPSDLVLPSERFKQLLADPGLRERFLPPMTEEEIAAVERLLDPVVEEVERWCHKWSIFETSHILAVTLLTIVNLPRLPADAILHRVKETLWVFALDDVLDGHSIPNYLLFAAVQECYLVACAAPPSALSNELAVALGQIRQEVELCPQFRLIEPIWTASLVRVLDGMMYEYWMQERFKPLRFSDPLPPLDEYMYYACGSIAVPHLWITSVALEPNRSLVDAVPELYRLAEQCAIPIRLANDLRTFERELEEGGVNAVAIRVHELGLSRPEALVAELVSEAKADIQGRIAAEQTRARQLAETFRTETGLEQGFIRATEFGVALYAKADFRNWISAFGQSVISS